MPFFFFFLRRICNFVLWLARAFVKSLFHGTAATVESQIIRPHAMYCNHGKKMRCSAPLKDILALGR